MIIWPRPQVSLGISNIPDKQTPPLGSWQPGTWEKSPESGMREEMGFGSSPELQNCDSGNSHVLSGPVASFRSHPNSAPLVLSQGH